MNLAGTGRDAVQPHGLNGRGAEVQDPGASGAPRAARRPGGSIRRFTVTDAARHDGGHLPDLLNPHAFDSRVWAGSAYRSKANEAAIFQTAGTRPPVSLTRRSGPLH